VCIKNLFFVLLSAKQEKHADYLVMCNMSTLQDVFGNLYLPKPFVLCLHNKMLLQHFVTKQFHGISRHFSVIWVFMPDLKQMLAVRSQSLPRDIYLHKTQLSRRKLSFVAKSSFVGIYLVGPKCVSLEFFFGNERR